MKKTSKRRQRASRANSLKSTGPRTPEGKARSSYNAVRHGMLARCTVLECEDRAIFEQLLQHFVRRFEPLDDVEFGMIEEMASCHWRMRRCWVAETQTMNGGVRKHVEVIRARNAELCIAGAIADPEIADRISLLNRYEGRLSRMYQRALRNLLLLRQEKAAASQTAVETKEDNPPEIEEIENSRTKLIPEMNTNSEPPSNPKSDAPDTPPTAASTPPSHRAALPPANRIILIAETTPEPRKTPSPPR